MSPPDQDHSAGLPAAAPLQQELRTSQPTVLQLQQQLSWTTRKPAAVSWRVLLPSLHSRQLLLVLQVLMSWARVPWQLS